MLTQDGFALGPYVEYETIWDFDESTSSVVAATLTGDDDDVRGRAGLGITATAPSGASIGFSGHYDGIGAGDFEAVSGELKLRLPLN